MCGRFVSSYSSEKISELFGAEDWTEGEILAPSYNVAPTDRVLIVRESYRHDERQRVVSIARWGLIPSWANDISIGGRLFNARCESVPHKPAFRRAFERHRCLLPADGWYEWVKRPDRKSNQPFFMTRRDGKPVALAGLWETWHDPETAQLVISTTVLTVPAVGTFADIHPRMPLVIPPEEWPTWLGETRVNSQLLLNQLCDSPDEELAAQMELRPVSTAVGNVANNTVELLNRAETNEQLMF